MLRRKLWQLKWALTTERGTTATIEALPITATKGGATMNTATMSTGASLTMAQQGFRVHLWTMLRRKLWQLKWALTMERGTM